MRKIIILILFLVLTSCTTKAVATPSPPAEAEEYAVYSAMIQSLYLDKAKLEQVVINDVTAVDHTDNLSETLSYVSQNLPGVTDDLMVDFTARNKQQQALKPLFNLPIKLVFINKSELDEIFKDYKGWDIFYARYPGSQGTMTLSRVGFNQGVDSALVYVGNQSDWLGGAGYYVLLNKENGQWFVRGQVMTWIS
jgi:hypothetical protein